MRRHFVLLTDCLMEPGPEIARRIAAAGTSLLLNGREDVPELGDLLQEIAESGGRAVACNLDPRDRERVEVVIEFVASTTGPMTGVVLQSGKAAASRPLEDTNAVTDGDSVAETVENATDWCRLVLPILSGAPDASLVGLWSDHGSNPNSVAASYETWEQVLVRTRRKAVSRGVDVHVVRTEGVGRCSSERGYAPMDTPSAADSVLSRLGILSR